MFSDDDYQDMLGQTSITAPGDYSVPTTSIPESSEVWVRAYWDTDGTGGVDPYTMTDQVVFEGPVYTTANTVVDLTIEVQTYITGTVFDTDGTTELPGKMVTISENDGPSG